jgi:hypothetical protein
MCDHLNRCHQTQNETTHSSFTPVSLTSNFLSTTVKQKVCSTLGHHKICGKIERLLAEKRNVKCINRRPEEISNIIPNLALVTCFGMVLGNRMRSAAGQRLHP